MITINHTDEMMRLRRFALSAQGLTSATPFGRGIEGAKNALTHLGYVQIDTISVVERAHHHVLFSRVPSFIPSMLNQLLVSGEIFEYWAHAAAFLPIKDFRFSLPYKQAIKQGQTHWFKNPDKKAMHELLARINADGPLRSRDLESNTKKRQGWWDWKPAKKALEQLYMQGDLMICDRDGFQKSYDLPERVLPEHVDTRVPSTEEFAEHLLDQNLKAHVLVTLKGITHQRRNPALRKAIDRLIKDRLSAGVLVEIQLQNGMQYLVNPDVLEGTTPRCQNRLHILSPFDNSLILRDRLKALFNFDYQLECYVPEAKRRFGYFSLPLLYRDQFIGRMDCKAHRKIRELEIKSLHWEAHTFDQDAVIAAFIKSLHQFCRFQNCDHVSLLHCTPKVLSAKIRHALSSLNG